MKSMIHIPPQGNLLVQGVLQKTMMKTKTFFFAVCLFLISGTGSVLAQTSSDKDEVKAKVTLAVERLDEAFKLDKEKHSVIEDIFSTFYQGQQKIKNNIQRPAPASGLAQGLAGQDFQNVRKKNEALIDERDKRLKKELTEEQYKKWKGEIEPSLHKRR
jgi:hypothetical protein